jgi:hypothetical protein
MNIWLDQIYIYIFFANSILIADYDDVALRRYVRQPAELYYMNDTVYSSDLDGAAYPSVCPYFSTCALSSSGTCDGNDYPFTFTGRVGIITNIVASDTKPSAWVTFNGGRTAYQFLQEDLQLEYRQRSMYGSFMFISIIINFIKWKFSLYVLECLIEVWWVVRNRSRRNLQKRKGFNVTSPDCTFDVTNNR